MPGKCRFQESWLEEEVWRLWLRPGKNASSAFCSLCKKFIDVTHSGVNDVKCHAKGKKYKQLEQNLKCGKQLTLHSFKNPTNGLQDVASKPSNLLGDEYSSSPSTSSAPSSSTADLLTNPNEPQLRLGLGQEPQKDISSFLLNDTDKN